MDAHLRELAIKAGAFNYCGYISDPATGRKKWAEVAGLNTSMLNVELFAKFVLQNYKDDAEAALDDSTFNNELDSLAKAYPIIDKHFQSQHSSTFN